MNEQHTLGLEILLDVDGVAPDQSAELGLVAKIEPRERGVETTRPALSVVFSLDVSGSMGGPPLEHVIQSVCRLIDLLPPEDRVGVVAFSDNATVVSELQKLDVEGRAALKRRVRHLEADGFTSIQAGLEVAAGLMPPRAEGERQLILLLSDGAPNKGISDADGLAGIAAKLRPAISISTLGFGANHHEDMLDAIATAGGGQYAYVASPLEADFEFARALGSQGDVVAEAVELTLKLEDGVEIAEQLSTFASRVGGGGLILTLPDIIEGQERYVVARLRVSARKETGPLRLMEATLRYRRAGAHQTREIAMPVIAAVTHRPAQIIPEARARVLLAVADQARAQARAQADRGQFEGAAAILRGVIAQLEATPAYRAGDGSDISEAVEQLIDEAMAYERRPNREEYRGFRRAAMGMDIQKGGAHHTDRKAISARSVLVAQGMSNDLPEAWLVGACDQLAGFKLRLGHECTIGRTQGNDIVLPSPLISKRQVRVVGHDGCYLLIDLQSTNGCYVNGERLGSPRRCAHGDVLQLGDFRLRYEEAGAVDLPHAQASDAPAPPVPAPAPPLPTSRASTGAWLEVSTHGVSPWRLDLGVRCTIGRGQDNDLVLPRPTIARRHALISLMPGGHSISDLGSTNGTYLNGALLQATTSLKPHDTIHIGDFTLRFHQD